MREGGKLWKKEGEIRRQEGGLVPETSFLDGQVDHGSITVTKGHGKKNKM